MGWESKKEEVDKITNWTREWNKQHAYGPNYLRYVSVINNTIDTDFLPLVPEDRRECVKEEIEKEKREKIFTYENRCLFNNLWENEVESMFDLVKKQFIENLKGKYLKESEAI